MKTNHATGISGISGFIATAAVALSGLAPAQTAAPDGATGWLDAAPGYEFTFPRDHGAHPDHKIEWWYWTGNLTADDGRPFGFQLTFFRSGVDRSPSTRSRWAIRDLYMAHFAVSDLGEKQFFHDEIFNRKGIGRAGDTFDPGSGKVRVWNDTWSAEISGSGQRLSARSSKNGFAVELSLVPAKPSPLVLNGEAGYSRKGSDPGNASLYYAMPRLKAEGAVTIGDRQWKVDGLAWMDREFGSSFLEDGQVGWDWFALHLDDGRDLMLYQLRREDGPRDRRSSGTLTAPDGSATALDHEDFTLEALRFWETPDGAATYPVAWRVRVPGRSIDLTVEAAFDGQELVPSARQGIRYWEGSVSVADQRDGGAPAGRGYLEMTGYADRALNRVFSAASAPAADDQH